MRIQLINLNVLNFVYLKNVQKLEKRNKKIMVKTISKEQIKIKKQCKSINLVIIFSFYFLFSELQLFNKKIRIIYLSQ